MIKSSSRNTSESYKKGSDLVVQLSAGNKSAKFLGGGTLVVDKLSIEDSMHGTGLNDTLVSGG